MVTIFTTWAHSSSSPPRTPSRTPTFYFRDSVPPAHLTCHYSSNICAPWPQWPVWPRLSEPYGICLFRSWAPWSAFYYCNKTPALAGKGGWFLWALEFGGFCPLWAGLAALREVCGVRQACSHYCNGRKKVLQSLPPSRPPLLKSPPLSSV